MDRSVRLSYYIDPMLNCACYALTSNISDPSMFHDYGDNHHSSKLRSSFVNYDTTASLMKKILVDQYYPIWKKIRNLTLCILFILLHTEYELSHTQGIFTANVFKLHIISMSVVTSDIKNTTLFSQEVC